MILWMRNEMTSEKMMMMMMMMMRDAIEPSLQSSSITGLYDSRTRYDYSTRQQDNARYFGFYC
jgi:hypothetical protein